MRAQSKCGTRTKTGRPTKRFEELECVIEGHKGGSVGIGIGPQDSCPGRVKNIACGDGTVSKYLLQIYKDKLRLQTLLER